MRTWMALSSVGLLSLMVVACAAKGGREPPPGLALSGVWALNASESGGPGSRLNASGTEGGMVTMRGGDPERMRRSMEVLQGLLRAGDRLTLEQRADQVTVTYTGDRFVTLPTDGAKLEQEWPDLGTVEFKAQWTETGLRIERKHDGVELRETLLRGPASPRLIISTEVRGIGPSSFDFRRVYDIVPDDSRPALQQRKEAPG